MNHSIISYSKEQSNLNLGRIQNSKCEIEVKIWEIQLPNIEKRVKFARFLYFFLVNNQIYKRIIKNLYFHGCLLLYRDLAKYSHGWSPLLLNPFYRITTLTTSQNSLKKFPLNLIFERVAADDFEKLDLILHTYVCVYVSWFSDESLIVAVGVEGKGGSKKD